MHSLEELPLHKVFEGDRSVFLGKGRWWACEHPERKAVVNETNFDLRCQACRIAAVAHLRLPGSWQHGRGTGGVQVRMDDAIEDAIKEAGADGRGEVISL